jgi:hypothetical protein
MEKLGIVYAYYFEGEIIYIEQAEDCYEMEKKIERHESNFADSALLIDKFIAEFCRLTNDCLDTDEAAPLRYEILDLYTDEQERYYRKQEYIDKYLPFLLNQENPNREKVYEYLLDKLEDLAVDEELMHGKMEKDYVPCQKWVNFRKEVNKQRIDGFCKITGRTREK